MPEKIDRIITKKSIDLLDDFFYFSTMNEISDGPTPFFTIQVTGEEKPLKGAGFYYIKEKHIVLFEENQGKMIIKEKDVEWIKGIFKNSRWSPTGLQRLQKDAWVQMIPSDFDSLIEEDREKLREFIELARLIEDR